LLKNHAAQLVMAGVVPCLALALVWFRIAPEHAADFPESKLNPDLAKPAL
jgi:hypothetical protein